MFSWIVFILGLVASWHYTDLQSENAFQSTISPILVGVFLILLLIKFVFLLGPDSGRGGHGGDSGGGFGGGDGGCGGGDGGGC
ncbi:hypothetical protein ACJJIG_03905 [Microbulbifer sp. SSSA007]|uniref:hypothetical protein n=1 Tax=unclassified Microbulbifer TaxID=2619833 RepID=UPI004039C709